MSKIDEPIKLLEQFYYGKRDYSLLSKAIELFRENQVAKSEPEPTKFPVEEIRNRTIRNHGRRNDEQLIAATNLLDALDEIDRLNAENKELSKRLPEVGTCRGCGEEIFRSNYCDKCNRLWES